MPSILNACLLSAVMLGALQLSALGAPAEYEPTHSPAGDPSGEEEGLLPSAPPLLASNTWDVIIGLIDILKSQNDLQATTTTLNNHRVSSLPESLPGCRSNKEACLHWVAENLELYVVFLMHVQKEYTNSALVADITHLCRLLISQIKQEMKKPERVKVLTSSEKEKLLKEIDNPDTFHRKMTALSILDQLREFLCDGKRKIRQKEMAKYNKNYTLLKISDQRAPQRN